MRNVELTGPSPSSPTKQHWIDPLLLLLSELRGVISSLSDEQYTRQPVGPVQSSISSHVRHSLDHFRAMLLAAEVGELNYDRRDRESVIQRDRAAALAEIDRLVSAVEALTPLQIQAQVAMTTLLTADGAPDHFQTHIQREIGYVISHTIHHNALMAFMMRLMGLVPPDRFGYAPSTILHEVTRSCVR